MSDNDVWSCTVRLVNREWKEELHAEEAMEASLLSAFGRIGLVARAAQKAGMDVRRIEFTAGPIYQAPGEDQKEWYGYRYHVFTVDGQKNEWELRCWRNSPTNA